ncbi:hypothetical protein [Neptuniibacter sp. QD37_11]|uniref:hypothetical protein n=1 Tax=Neptuniibacter sp. QD37_11 TaxID=3398209 RepID=UPI0039F55B41
MCSTPISPLATEQRCISNGNCCGQCKPKAVKPSEYRLTAPNFEDADALIGYCEYHCQTEAAKFSGKQINDMIALAGYPEAFAFQVTRFPLTPYSVDPEGWWTVHEAMEELVELATLNLQAEQNAVD